MASHRQETWERKRKGVLKHKNIPPFIQESQSRTDICALKAHREEIYEDINSINVNTKIITFIVPPKHMLLSFREFQGSQKKVFLKRQRTISLQNMLQVCFKTLWKFRNFNAKGNHFRPLRGKSFENVSFYSHSRKIKPNSYINCIVSNSWPKIGFFFNL